MLVLLFRLRAKFSEDGECVREWNGWVEKLVYVLLSVLLCCVMLMCQMESGWRKIRMQWKGMEGRVRIHNNASLNGCVWVIITRSDDCFLLPIGEAFWGREKRNAVYQSFKSCFCYVRLTCTYYFNCYEKSLYLSVLHVFPPLPCQSSCPSLHSHPCWWVSVTWRKAMRPSEKRKKDKIHGISMTIQWCSRRWSVVIWSLIVGWEGRMNCKSAKRHNYPLRFLSLLLFQSPFSSHEGSPF